MRSVHEALDVLLGVVCWLLLLLLFPVLVVADRVVRRLEEE